MAGNITTSDIVRVLAEGRVALPNQIVTETLTGALTLDKTYGCLLQLDPGGAARDVTLPAEEGADGMFFFITNTADAAETITLKNDAGGTIMTIEQDRTAIVYLQSGTWTPFLKFADV